MSCYLRHIAEILEEAGVDLNNKADRQAADKAIHELVGVEYKDCPNTWRIVKQFKADEGFKTKLVSKIREAVE